MNIQIRYENIRIINKEMGLKTRIEYIENASKHPKYIDDPERTFNNIFISWYDYLGVDCSRFPKTKEEFLSKCRASGIVTWAFYKEAAREDLPKNPGEMYHNFTQWDKEFGIEDELVW